MSELVAKLDDLGQPAWIAVMVLGFVLFWPVGLAVLAYLIWSGRMGCARNGGWSSRWERKMQKFQDKMDRWGSPSDRARGFAAGFGSSGNRAFDDYREATMKRLEDEFSEFKSFLDRLREAKDRQEFEQFMNDRRNRGTGGTSVDTTPSNPNPPPSGGSQFRP